MTSRIKISEVSEMILYICEMKYLICCCQVLKTKSENGRLTSDWKTYLILLPTDPLKSLTL